MEAQMAVKRIKYRVGALAYSRAKVGASDTSQEAIDALDEMLERATPRGRVANWRRIAEGNAQALGLLDQAEKLIDERGSLGGDRATADRFDLLMLQAEYSQQIAKTEESLIPRVVRDVTRQKGCTAGGQESGRSRRGESDRASIIERARALLAEGKDRRALAEILAKRFNCTPRHIRNILKESGI